MEGEKEKREDDGMKEGANERRYEIHDTYFYS
jgi:hypothetical protein